MTEDAGLPFRRPRSYADPTLATSMQSVLSAAAWAALNQQCLLNYEKLRHQFNVDFPSYSHTQALTEHIRQISKRRWPTTINYMLWLIEAACTTRGHTHNINHEVK